MKKILFSALAVSTFAVSAEVEKVNTRIDGVLKYTPLIYEKSVFKDKGFFSGAYIYFGYGLKHLLEAEMDYTQIDYKTGFKLKQYDFTLSYTNFSVKNIRFRLGTHYISSNDDWTDNSITGFLEATYYKLYQWELGVEGYITYYKDYPVNIDKKGLYIYQGNIKFGYSFGNYYKYGRFYLFLKPYYIYLSDNLGLKDSYTSIEGNLSYYYKSWTLSGFGYYGEQVFPVKNGGFVVFNTAERRQFGYGTYLTYTFYPKASITASFFREQFKDLGLNNKAYLNNIMLILGYTF